MSSQSQVRKRKPLSQLTELDDGGTKKKRSNAPQKRAGTIMKMTLKNFMCHSMLDVDLSCNINIIIGRNGSGKSAILTALIVGLGGKASLTNRGSSVKNFIKAGKASGSVEIVLYNGGPMAYRPGMYGEKITILRHFTAGGGGHYKIRSENGDVIATQVREIHNITTALNIQVDNPICILNQDTSRNFLSSNDPKHKFALFMKATKLETLFEEYKKISLNRREAVRIFQQKQESFNELQEEMRSVKRKIDTHRSIVGMHDRIKAMQSELMWATVRDAETEVKKEEQKLKNCEKKLDDLKSEIENRAQQLKQMKEKISSLNQQMVELKDTFQVQSRPQNDVKNIIEELKEKFSDRKRQCQLIQSTIETKIKESDFLKNEIQNANENMSRVEQEKAQRLRDLNNLNEKIKAMDDHLQTCRNDLTQLNSDGACRENEKQNLQHNIQQIEHQLRNERSSLNALKSETGNTLLLYGQDVPKVKQMIEQNKARFKHIPRGPLGSYMKLKDKKWALAVESFLGAGLLSAFTVDNNKDNQLLVQIFNQVYGKNRKPLIITSKFFFKTHDVSSNLCQSPNDCVSLYNALEIDDPVVANCIIDQGSIERILLIPNDQRAQQLLSRAAYVPKNCRQAVTMKGDKYYPDPNYKTYGNQGIRARFLQVDTKEHLIQLEQSITELSEKKTGVENELSALCRDIREQDTKKYQLEEKIRKLNTAKIQIRRQLEALKATAEPEVASVELLQSELSAIETSLQEKKAQLKQIIEESKEIKVSLAENEEKLRKLKEANSNLEDRMRGLEEQVQETVTQQREIQTGEQFEQRKTEEFEAKLNAVKTELAVKQNTVTEHRAQAVKLGERVNSERKVPEIVAEINHLELRVRKIETATENTEELLEKYNTFLEKFNNVSTLLNCLNMDINELNMAVDKRNRHYKMTEDYFIAFIKRSFQEILKVRQFQGSIEINLNEKILDLVVIPQHGSQGVSRTCNLSGGERSFSTVAFLHSLWQCMEFPVYFLDEFDVFMDKANRTKVFEILLHHAQMHGDLQFVFLTPQDVSFVKNDVRVLKLQDPERNHL